MATSSSLTNNEVETYFAKVLSPIKKEADPNLVAQFCQKLNNNFDGIQTAIRLITNKMQSSQEWEALISLYLLEACVKNCGSRFHAEIGKFRFLNEMIKLVSPKYLANQTSDKVKKRCIEIIYSWTKGLTNEPKIVEAYEMLKRQGIVDKDPINVDILVINVPPRIKNPIFEDNEKSKKLEKLLQGKNPTDLEEANRIIKQMVKQDEIKSEKISLRINELEQINNNVKLLNEMLFHYKKSSTSESEKETMKYVHDELEKSRNNLVKLATETDDNDDGIGDIIKTNETVERILNQYKTIVVGNTENLLKVEDPDDIILNTDNNTNTNEPLKYDPLKELQDLFSNISTTTTSNNNNQNEFGSFICDSSSLIGIPQNNDNLLDLNNILPLKPSSSSSSLSSSKNNTMASSIKPKIGESFGDFGILLLEQTLTNEKRSQPQSQSIQPLESLIMKSTTKKLPSLAQIQQQQQQQILTNNNENEHLGLFNSLNNILVPLETVKPSSKPPLTVYEKNDVKVVFHFGRDSPQLHIYVIVVSITSTNSFPINKISFQAAIPKKMRVKLQTPSTNELPAFNPILPLSAVTQVMLIANPTEEKVKLRFKINYSTQDKLFNDFGDIDELRLSFDLI